MVDVGFMTYAYALALDDPGVAVTSKEVESAALDNRLIPVKTKRGDEVHEPDADA